MGPLEDLDQVDDEFDDTSILDATGIDDTDDDPDDWNDFQTSEE